MGKSFCKDGSKTANRDGRRCNDAPYKKMGYKTVTDFYNELADEHIDVNRVIDLYLEIDKKKTKSNTKLVRQKNLLYKKNPTNRKKTS